jgi:hypothetical protein
VCLADIVHAGRGDRLDAGVDLRSRQSKAAASADTEHADPLAVHKGQPAEEVDTGAEVLHEGFG